MARSKDDIQKELEDLKKHPPVKKKGKKSKKVKEVLDEFQKETPDPEPLKSKTKTTTKKAKKTAKSKSKKTPKRTIKKTTKKKTKKELAKKEKSDKEALDDILGTKKEVIEEKEELTEETDEELAKTDVIDADIILKEFDIDPESNLDDLLTEVGVDPKDWDYISFYVNTMNEMVDSDENMKELCAIFTIGAMTGPNWYYIDASVKPEHYRYADKTYFNIGACTVGMSGGARKSRTIRKIMQNQILRRTVDKLLVPTKNPNLACKEISQFIPSDLTVASLVKAASERKTILSIPRVNYDTTHCIITQIDPEFTTVVERAQGKFNVGMFQVLSQFLSGESYHKGTISGGDLSVEEPYFNMFIGAQEHYPKILPPAVWTQGFPNRFFYAIDEYGITNVYTGTRIDRKKFKRGQPAEKLKIIRLWLKMVQKIGGVCVFKAEKEPRKLIEDFDEKIFRQQGNPQVNRYLRGYLGRLPDYATKLACIHNISKRTPERLRQDLIQSGYVSYSYSVNYLSVEDVKWGIKQVGFYLKQFEKLIDFLMEKSYIKAVPTREAMWMVVWSAIRGIGVKNRSGLASKTEIIRKTRISRDELDRVLEDLLMGQYIIRKEELTKGRKRNVYKTIERPTVS